MKAESKVGALGALDRQRKIANTKRGLEPRAHQSTPLEAPDDVLERYFAELQALPLLDAAEELALAQEIEQLELEHWTALLGYRPAFEILAEAVQSLLPDAVPNLTGLRKVARERRSTQTRPRPSRWTHAVAATAQALRQIDLNRVALKAADAAISAAFAADPRARAYLGRVTRAAHAEQRAKGRFVAANLRLVIGMARRYDRRLMPLSDLIQEGNLGLLRAVERFDYRRGYRFSTYATWWIRHSLNRALSDKARLIRVPVHALDDRARLARAEGAAIATTGEAPSTQELAKQLGMSTEKLELLGAAALAMQTLSLDRPLGADREQTLHDLLPTEHGDPDQALDRSAWSAGVDELLGSLTSMEASILRYRFGLGGDEEMTLREIGLKYNLSRERIRQIQAEALTKLRETLQHKPIPGAERLVA